MARLQKRKAQKTETSRQESAAFISGKFTPGQVVEHRINRGLQLLIVSGPRISRLNNVQYTIKTPKGIEMPVLEANLI